MDRTRIYWALWKEGRGRERGESGAAAGGQKVQKGPITKISRLYREEYLGEGKSSPGAEKFRVGNRVCQPYPVTSRA